MTLRWVEFVRGGLLLGNFFEVVCKTTCTSFFMSSYKFLACVVTCLFAFFLIQSVSLTEGPVITMCVQRVNAVWHVKHTLKTFTESPPLKSQLYCESVCDTGQ